jgi:hypothetical protein
MDVLLGESIGLQDVLTDCGEEAAVRAVQLAELEAELGRSVARVRQVCLPVANARIRMTLANAFPGLLGVQAKQVVCDHFLPDYSEVR